MRLISNEELHAVAGGGLLDEVIEFFTGKSTTPTPPSSCVPSTNTAGGVTSSQLCGANGASTVVVSTPGVVTTITTTPGSDVSGSLGVGYKGINGQVGGGSTGPATVTTTICIGGGCTTTTSTQNK